MLHKSVFLIHKFLNEVVYRADGDDDGEVIVSHMLNPPVPGVTAQTQPFHFFKSQ